MRVKRKRPAEANRPWSWLNGKSLVELTVWPACGDVLEGQGQLGEGIDVIHLGGLQKGRDCDPCLAAAVGSGTQRVLAGDGHRPFILPMSAKSGKFTIVGIPISAGRSMCGG